MLDRIFKKGSQQGGRGVKHCICSICRMYRQWAQAKGKKNIKRMDEIHEMVWERMEMAETELAMKGVNEKKK